MHHSAGAVVIDEGRCLVMRRGREWIFPKGHIEPGESAEDTARREVLEEAGIEIEVGPAVGSTRYGFQTPDGRWNRKRVEWFVARRIGGELRLEPIFDEAAFVAPDDALARLTFPADRRMARRAFAAVAVPTREEAGPAEPAAHVPESAPTRPDPVARSRR
jgi:diadenosine hexaphosphate hydrolase (ATP-forming)